MRVDERTARVPGVERGIGLDDVLDHATVPGGKRPAKGAHDTGRDGGVEPERIPDSDHELADPKRLGLGELGDRQARAEDADHGEVCRAVGAHDRRCQLGAAVERDRDLARAVDDVRVRQGVAIGRDDDAAAAAPAAPNVDDARRDLLDDGDDGLRVRVEKRARRVWLGPEGLANFGRH